MPELESQESDAERKNQQGEGLKILTPNQMLSRLPISLAEVQAGNNSQKLKNEIRQLLYSLYRSKNMTKEMYNNLIKNVWIVFILPSLSLSFSFSLLLLLLLLLKMYVINGNNFYEY